MRNPPAMPNLSLGNPMMRLFLAAALALAFAAGPTPAEAKAPGPARARVPSGLPSLFSDEDYPLEALLNDEQGTVGFKLAIGVDGAITGCTIESSSGSPSLDSTTCRLLAERARFTPARDKKGRPATDTYSGRIVWRIPDDGGTTSIFTPAADAAMELWSFCARGEAAKLVESPLSPPQIADRALAACTQLEALAARELAKVVFGATVEQATVAFKGYVRTLTEETVETWRAGLKAGEEE